MFISPKTAIENNWVKFPTWMSEEQKNKCIQPNALDWTIDRLFSINEDNTFVISETSKKMRGGSEIQPVPNMQELSDVWHLRGNACYDIMSDFYVDVPKGVAVLLYPRSTFVRNGLFLSSGIFDSGFSGNLGCVMHNRSGKAMITKGTRIGQVAFLKSEDSGIVYAGGYNTDQGQHWATKVTL